MATKKITELPFINTLSGSSVFDNPNQNVVVPVVLKGTTNQITVENFSKFTNLYAAQTGSQNIFTQNQWFNTTVSASTINVGTLGVGGNTTIAGTLGVTGNGTIGGNLAVAGRITAEEFYTEITTASVIYASGSTKFGDDTTDTHEFTGSINVSGSVIYNGVILSNIDANTIQRLQQATASIQQATASLNTFTASQDGRNFILSQVTGSFAGEIGGLEAYTASLKTAAIVSSSTQILNYNIFATTASNTFVGNQNITGSLSISAGEFNVTTGSGNMTSSLIFDHTQNDGVTLGLRHNDRLSLADHTINVKVWAGGVYTTFVRNGTPYSVLNVEAFDDNKIYLYRDTRLYNKSLVIDNNLTVQNGVVIGSGSLLVNGVITGSILATNGVISSSNQLFELNEFTASQDSRNLTLSTVTGSLIGITNGLMAFTAALDNTYATDAQLYQLYQATRSLELHSGSMVGVTNGLMAYTASNTSLNTGLRGEVDGIEAYTASLKGQAIVSSSTQVQNYDVFALNSNLYTSTGSLIGITNGLMAFTAALDSTYATDAQLYQLYQATQSLELLSGSLIGITNGLMAFTAALDSTYATDAQLYQLYAETASIKAEIAGIEAYTASLKAAAIVSSSTQITNYYKFAETASANTFYGTQTINGNLQLSSTSPLVYNAGNTNAMLFGFFDGSSIYGPYYQIFGSNYSNVSQRGSAEFVFDSRNGGYSGFNIAEFNGSTWLRKFRVSPNGAEVTGSFVVEGGITGSLMATNNVVSSSTQIQNYNLFAVTSSANSFYGAQSVSGSLFVTSNSGFGTSDATGSGILKVISAGTQIAFSVGQSNSKRFTGFSANDLKVYGDDYFITTTDAFPLSLGTNNTSRITIASDGGINATGAITASNFRISTAGGGIDFSVTSNGSGTTTSELLDDYEVGTFTPTIVGGTTAGTATYSARSAQYTKVGNCVHFRADIIWTGHTGTGLMSITGLPFAIGSNYQTSIVARFDQTTSANTYIGGAYIYSSQIDMQVMPVGGGAPANLNITAAGDLRVSGFYFTT